MPRRVGLAVRLAAVALVGAAAVLVAAGLLPAGIAGPWAAGLPVAMAPPRFVDEARSAAIEHVYDGDFPFFVGGGVAVFDCDGDRLPDLYVAGGANPAGLYRNRSAVGGRLRFEAVPGRPTDLASVTGAYPLDVDGDDVMDLAVLRLGENVLLRGAGDCQFERANEAWGFAGGDAWTVGFSAAWEGEAALPTLAFGNYLALDELGGPADACADNVLNRPRPEGPPYADPIRLSPGFCTLSILFSDWDRSGRRDLRMTNDRHYSRDGEEQLWRVAAGESPRRYTSEDGWQTMRIWGMGIASHDLTGDGYPEVYLTSQADNKLQTLADGPARPRYEDIALRRGATAHRPFTGDTTMPSTAWHAEFQDVNNDALTDLYVAKGNVEAMPDFAARDPSNLLLGQADGTFAEAAEAAGIVGFGRARGAALADLNVDGMLDLVEVNRRENIELWRSVGWGSAETPRPMGDWLAVSPQQPGGNRDAIGSWIEVRVGQRTTRREVTVGGGHAGGQLGWVHFGLGDADRAEVRVVWPDGEVGPWLDVGANQFVDVERRAGEVRPWAAGR